VPWLRLRGFDEKKPEKAIGLTSFVGLKPSEITGKF